MIFNVWFMTRFFVHLDWSKVKVSRQCHVRYIIEIFYYLLCIILVWTRYCSLYAWLTVNRALATTLQNHKVFGWLSFWGNLIMSRTNNKMNRISLFHYFNQLPFSPPTKSNYQSHYKISWNNSKTRVLSILWYTYLKDISP